MSDLEQQRRAYNAWGKNDYVPRSAGGPSFQLTPEQRALCSFPGAAQFAQQLERFANERGRYFTLRTVHGEASRLGLIQLGERAGLWVKDGAKDYWRHTAATWPWIRTSIALFDEQARAEGSAGR